MEENNSANFAIANIIDLGKFSTKTQFSVAIDANAHINKILNIQTYIYDINTESQEGKATIAGKVALKVLYQDVDGIFNTISDTTNFSEVLANSAITANCKILVSNMQCSNTAEFDEKFLKVSCFIMGSATCCFNLGFSCMQDEVEGMFTKKNSIDVMDVVQNVQTEFTNTDEVDLKEKANKILVYGANVFAKDFIPYDGYALVEGELELSVIYETEEDGQYHIKLFKESYPFKKEIEVSLCDKDCMLDLEVVLNNARTIMNAQFEDNNTKLSFEHFIEVRGFCFKTRTIDVACDAYSIDNDITLNNVQRTLNHKQPLMCFKEDVNLEMSLDDDTQIDEIIGITNVETSITSLDTKNSEFVFEGLFSATLLYFDENKQIASMNIELPINLSHAMEQDVTAKLIHFSSRSSNAKIKLKRGNVLDIDFEFEVCASCYTESEIEVLQSVKFGKAIDHGDIAFQIYLAKENEELWDLCKRIKIAPNEIIKCNKELTFPCRGKEKIVVYR